MTAAVPQIFVRNREGKVYGPIEPSTVELLIEGGVLQGMLQVSLDGEKYALPFRFPEVRDFFPRHLWGDENRREVPLDESHPAEEVVSAAPAAAAPGQAVGFGTFMLGEDEPVLAPTDLGATRSEGTPGLDGSPAAQAAPSPPASPSRSAVGAAPPVLGAPPAGPAVTGSSVAAPKNAARPAPAPAPPILGGAAAPGGPAGAPPRTPTGAFPVLTPAAPTPTSPATAAQQRTPTGKHAAVAARGPDRPPTGTFPAMPPVTPLEPAAPGEARPRTGTFPAMPPVISAEGTAPRDSPSRPRTGTFPTMPPVIPAEPASSGEARPRTGTFPAMPPVISAENVEGWGAAVPFELAPPGETRPPQQTVQPLSSTFSVLRAELSETNALRIYAEGARAGATGLFFFDLPDRTITIYLRRGNPESAESTHSDDSIGPFLVAARLATTEQVTKGEREALKYGNDVLAAMFTLGLVNPGLVFPALAQRAAGLLLQAYLATKGSFRFESVDLPPSKVVPLGNRWGLLAEVIRRVPLSDLKARLIDVRERPVVKRGTGDSMMDLRLTAQETRALSYFDGARSLANLAQSNSGEMDTILRVALLLREIDAASFPDVPPRAVPPPPPSRPPPPPVASPPPVRSTPTPMPHAAPSGTPRPPPSTSSSRPIPAVSRATPVLTPTGVAGLPQADPPRIAPVTAPPPRPAPSPAAAAAELRDLQARLERMRKESAFQILGVPDYADSAVVKAAYFKLAKQFHPDTIAAGASPDLARVKAEIFAAIGEANRILSDPEARARYKQTLAEGGPADVDVQALLQAEETFNKGVVLVRARRFVEAVKAFDTAITANSKEGEFYAWRGYARYFTNPDKKVSAVDALRDLNQALKLNERCAQAHYFIGQIQKLGGDSAGALKHFKKCVHIDATHVDAQREIRLLSGK